jgi:glycosyltransferase involved in cell wall biosynthesis
MTTPRTVGQTARHLAIYIRSIKSARGAEQVAALLAKGLADRACRVDFLVEDEQGWLVDELRSYSPNIAIRNLVVDPTIAAHEAIYRVYVALRMLLPFTGRWPHQRLRCRFRCAHMLLRKKFPVLALRRYIKGSRPEAVIAHLNDANTALMMAHCGGRLPSRLLVTIHNTISRSVSDAGSKWKRNVPELMRCLFHRANHVIAVSHGVAEDLRRELRLTNANIEVVYNPVVRPELHDLAREPVPHPWLADAASPVLVAASKLKPQKDLGMLLRAFAVLRQRRPVRLILLGEGPELDALRALAQQLGIDADVHFAGFVQNPFAYYSRARLFVMSSAWEGLPTALIEALACGCPVVSTDCPSGPREILDGGRYGTLVPVGDHLALAQAMDAALDAQLRPDELMMRASLFSIDNSVEHYEKLAYR